jgi:hypothetical protein
MLAGGGKGKAIGQPMEQHRAFAADDPAPAARLFRRRVFYIPGYDPNPARRYRELYRREGAAQAELSGYRLQVGGRGRAGPASWRVRAEIEGMPAETEIEVLVWSDLVQGSMRQGLAATYGQLVRTAWIYLSSGALWRLARLRKGPVIAALYPVLFLLLQLALALALGWAATRGLAWFADAAWPGGLGGGLWGVALQAGVAAGVVWAVLAAFRRQDRRFFAHYLMHDYAFTAGRRGASPPGLEARLAQFEARIAAALDQGPDEVLVVGHSSGAHLAVMTLAALLRRRSPPAGTALGLLTLGQVVPMVSFLPRAGALRRDLRQLSQTLELAWVDVSAPGDGCAFALCDPVATAGVAPPDRRWPLVISAAFTQTLSPARQKALRRRYFRLHFQYLCAFDRPGGYDYFAITAGARTLARRFAGRAPSRSRIERPLSGYRDMAP